jgi:hypothetical protein
MIICLESSILGGYLSNEVPGLVTGMLHLAGLKQPMRVELTGNFLRDIAGCRVDFHNPLPEGDIDTVIRHLGPHQNGFAGVMTASYRVARLPRRRNVPNTTASESDGLKNLLFFEWFNQEAQRILIQSWHLHLRVSAPRWQLTVDEEATLLRQSRARRKHFLLHERGDQKNPSALHAPGMADPFEPDAYTGNPFASIGEPDWRPQHAGEKDQAPPDPSKRSTALAQELRRFEQLLVFNNELQSRPAVLRLLSTVADLAAHLIHVLRQFSESKTEKWSFLVVDLEQSLPLFSAALNATDKLIQHPTPGMDQQWLSNVQACLLNIELRMRELLTLLR